MTHPLETPAGFDLEQFKEQFRAGLINNFEHRTVGLAHERLLACDHAQGVLVHTIISRDPNQEAEVIKAAQDPIFVFLGENFAMMDVYRESRERDDATRKFVADVRKKVVEM